MTVLDTPAPKSPCAAQTDSVVTAAVARSAEVLPPASARSTIRLERRDGHLVAALRGEISCDAVDHLSDLVEALALERGCRLVLDLSRLYDLDEAAITRLGELRDELIAGSGGLWLTGLRPWVRRLFEHMCTKDAFRIRRTIADAVAEMATSKAC
ncbi:MAG TPA: STAS domain-containing protein [Actinocrinis sp.]|nr:STAS domain-containing protein [Actinocrinis sp.]